MVGNVDIMKQQICLTQNQLIPKEGPRAIPINLDFTVNDSFLVDTSQLQQRNDMTVVQAVYIDNYGNSNVVIIEVQGGGQRIVAAPNTQGYYTILVPNPAKMVIGSTLGSFARVFLLNSPISGHSWSTV